MEGLDPRRLDLTLARMAEQVCRREAAKELLVDHDLRLTGAHALDRIARFAGALAALGLKRGAHVALLAPTGVRHMVAFLACQRLGLVTCTLHAREPAATLAGLVDWIEADVLVCHPDFADAGRAIRATAARRPTLVSLADGDPEAACDWRRALSAAPVAAVEVAEDEPAVILLSSGTTGIAKGVIQTHRGVIESARAAQAFAPDLGSKTIALVAVAASFAAWLYGTMTILNSGGTLVLWARYDPREFAAIVEREKPDFVPVVPTMIRLLPPELDGDPRLASIRTVAFGGEAPHRADIERLLGWGLTDVRAMYFAAELGRGSSTWCSHREMLEGRWGSAGRAVPNAEVRIVDPEGPLDAIRPVGETGEIVVRGPSVARGYWKDSERTKRVFVDGWWRSGDLGYVDDDGYLYVRGRTDNVINSGGIKVNGEEVEQALMACPGVRQAAVVGAPDDRWGQRIVAHLVAPGVETATIERHLAGSSLAAVKHPKAYRFHASLPTGATGKIDRRALAKLT